MLLDDIDSFCLLHACTCGCFCGATQKLNQFQQDQRVIQFLMGLNESYGMMRGSILMRSHLPSLGHVYSLLLQEEAQRDINSSSSFITDSAALNVHSSRFNSQFTKSKFGATDKKSSLHFNYCKKPGHLIDKCYKLHGFPPDFKFTKNRKLVASVEGPDISTYNKYIYFITIVDDFTRTTWTHLLSHKSNAFTFTKNFIALVKVQYHCQVECIRTDNALELGSSTSATDFLHSQGILHQTSCAYTPQQKRVVERKHKYILETSRALFSLICLFLIGVIVFSQPLT